MQIKNKETEKKCEEIVEIYFAQDYRSAMIEFDKWVVEKKLSKIEYIIVVERIKELILIRKGNKL